MICFFLRGRDWKECFLGGDTVDGRNPARRPVQGTVVYPTIFQGFITIPGGWEWDF